MANQNKNSFCFIFGAFYKERHVFLYNKLSLLQSKSHQEEMEKIQDQLYHDAEYASLQHRFEENSLYELTEVHNREDKRDQQSISLPGLPSVSTDNNEPKQRQSFWSKPLLFITVLLCLILILLIIILGIVTVVYVTGINVECTNTATGASSSSNTNEWADRIAQIISQKIPDFNEWANGVVSQVNSNVTGSLPDFNEWANGVVSKVNSNVTRSLPDFNEWANGVVSKVNSNVTGDLPDFNEWANGVVSKVNSNVTGSLPDFNEWADCVSQNTLQLFQNNTNFTELDKQILQTTRDSAINLINIVNTLSNLQDTSTSTAGVVDDILLIAQELLVLHNDSTALPTSCKEIKERQPLSPSGYYILVALNGGAYETYCNMGTLCSSGGGWTRLAYLGMSDATQNCPSGFRLYQSGGVRACGRTNSGAGCVSVQFPSNGISYSQICGRVAGYQYHSPDAAVRRDINSYYVDGVSITRGSPRQHVWTFINGFSDSYNINNCNCNQQPQAFIGNNYFCESGNPTNDANQFFTADPLWDGQNCGSYESTCCSATGIPWFHRDYGSTTTTDYIELRVCGDEGTSNEDSPVGYYEIYIK